ncbi:MAG: glycosyltransferase [Thermoproteota archaeon]
MGQLVLTTIAAKNYLANVRVLAKSFQKYNPDSRVIVLLIDYTEDYLAVANESFEVITIEELGALIPDLYGFIFQYDILELATAVKPYLFQYLYNKYGLRKLLYLDPDIMVFNSLDQVERLLDNYQMILTPHILSPIEDRFFPSEHDILKAGVYNLGFLALRFEKESLRFVDWWAKHLYKQCLVDLPENLFVDQRWMDFAPAMASVLILKEPGYNVAYWNFHERKITEKHGNFKVNDRPLFFAHFSGFNPFKPQEFSRHQNRFNMSELGDGSKLFGIYLEELINNGYKEMSRLDYSWATFSNGERIPKIARRIFLKLEDRAHFGNPFLADVEGSFYNWLLEKRAKNLPKLLEAIYFDRPDLQRAFPNPASPDGQAGLRAWLEGSGRSELQLGEGTLRALKGSLDQSGVPLLKNAQLRIRGTVKRFLRQQYHSLRRYKRLSPVIERLKPVFAGSQVSFRRPELPDTEVTSSELPRGLNILGYVHSEKGVGEAVRGIIAAVASSGEEYVVNNVTDEYSANVDSTVARITTSNPFAINLLSVNADQLPFVAKHLGNAYMEGRYNIGYWAWELSCFPEEWLASFDYLDEVWAPSTFAASAIAKVSPVPVVTMPHAVRATVQSGYQYDRAHFGLSKGDFVFLFMFDFDSYIARKNPYAVIRSFLEAFGDRKEGVKLYIKTVHGNNHLDEFQQLLKVAKSMANIEVHDQVLSREETESLVQCSDCYVSLHRAEGFGLTIAEAMAMGKPVIATGYSGNMDFMTVNNSFPIKYSIVRLDENHGPYKKGMTWAEPDIEDAARAMQLVYGDRELRLMIGERAASDIARYFSPGTIGEYVKNRMDKIRQLSPKFSGT